ncbi:tRNA-splicing endonuclease subunit [Coemansia javaensis]|uniref:tRNA-intron lyase n=1 Tax=Coemansia javaensis TaxID=2761396 RepID=A0A9W8HAH0_9FUNG|nr:tRNA-splicing endonuclease subunit [Coemansia javaensis]
MQQRHRLQCAGGHVLVADADLALALRTEHRVVGSLEGSHPTNPLQNNYLGLPLVLLPEEAALLVAEGAAEIAGDPFAWPETDRDRLRFALFRDLHARGFYVTRGVKFGGDYLLYPGEPMRHHSSHVVTLVDRDQGLAPRELVAVGRVCTAVKKTRLLSAWDPGRGRFTHIALSWSGM